MVKVRGADGWGPCGAGALKDGSCDGFVGADLWPFVFSQDVPVNALYIFMAR